MTGKNVDTFVTPAWLAAHLDDPKIIALDASFYLPDEGRNADALFVEAHIPGAVRFDVDRIADDAIALPHMLPDAETFGRMAGALGLDETMTIVVYDATDLIGGARAWWMLEHYGAADVRILEGGFKAWLAGGHPTTSGPSRREPKSFAATHDPSPVVDARQVLAASSSGDAQIVDARAAPRYAGSVPEPRAGLRAGHIPGARNVPWRALVDEGGKLRPASEIAACLREGGRRARPADHHVLWLGRLGLHPPARTGAARQAGRKTLRRVVVGMGRARRSPNRDRAGHEPIRRRPSLKAHISACISRGTLACLVLSTSVRFRSFGGMHVGVER